MADLADNPAESADPHSLLLAEAALSDVIRRRRAGESADDESILAEHPQQLRDLLADRLAKLKLVQRALSGHSPATDEQPDQSLRLPRISDRYQLLREINHGGQAVIFLARDAQTDRNVAIKVLRSGALADDRERQRFEREAEILSQLRHPNIVAILDRGRTPDGLLYLVMNYIAGEPLAAERLIERPLAERLALFIRICRIVQVAHERKIVHRDLKPSNIRVDDRGTPHVLDFGLAVSQQSLFASMTVTGQFLGTFLWASPEQATGGGDVTPASDVYSLGVILYQLITGGAFPPQVFAVVSEAIERGSGSGGSSGVRGSREVFRARRPAASIPAPLLELVGRCLERAPEDRFADAGAVANAVEAFLAMPPSRAAGGRLGTKVAIGAIVIALVAAAWLIISSVTPKFARTQLVNGRPAIVVLGRQLHWIPPGEAELGAPINTPWWVADERKHRFVLKRGFYMAPEEVDRDLYRQVMGVDPPSPVSDPENKWSRRTAVVNVSWHDAQEFCRRVSQQTGLRVRLPTEDEWEYAARAGQAGPYPQFITDLQLVSRYANFNDRSSPLKNRDDRFDDASPTVATNVNYIANRWMLSHMLGNVWEWTAEPYRHDLSANALASQATTQPLHISTRGGSWCDDPFTFRYSNRNPLPADFKQNNVGFRIVCDEP